MTMTSLRNQALTPSVSEAPRSRDRIVIHATRTAREKAEAALDDLRQTFELRRLVWKLSLLDIRLRYRGSLLGPFWLTLSTGVMVGALGFLYAELFHMDLKTYFPYLSLSLVLWGFISSVTGEGCTSFTQSESMIRANRMPLALHAARAVMRNLLVFAHNITVIVAVFAIMRRMPGVQSYMALPGLVLWAVDAFALALLLGAFCARFRDVPPIVGSIMQIAFFVTPIIWSPSILMHRGIGRILIDWNPFYALLEIVRAPLLGSALLLSTWAVALGYSLLLILVTGVFFAFARPRIAYWV